MVQEFKIQDCAGVTGRLSVNLSLTPVRSARSMEKGHVKRSQGQPQTECRPGHNISRSPPRKSQNYNLFSRAEKAVVHIYIKIKMNGKHAACDIKIINGAAAVTRHFCPRIESRKFGDLLKRQKTSAQGCAPAGQHLMCSLR